MTTKREPTWRPTAYEIALAHGRDDMRAEWRRRAACQSADPDAFFVEKGSDVDKAKRICAICPVKSECLECALSQGSDTAGVWGGMSRNERRRLRKQRKQDG